MSGFKPSRLAGSPRPVGITLPVAAPLCRPSGYRRPSAPGFGLASALHPNLPVGRGTRVLAVLVPTSESGLCPGTAASRQFRTPTLEEARCPRREK